MVNVRADDLRKVFSVAGGKEVAVDSVDLSVNDGEFVTIVGPSGCGKTTLLRMVAGLEIPSSGSLFFGDRDVTDLPPQDRNLSMVFQNVALFPFKTTRENIQYGLKYTDTSDEDEEQKIEETAELLGISDMLDKKPNQLSGGQRQRVSIARALVRDPSVFLFDEPMSDLDAKLKIEMRAELKELHQEFDLTVLYVTHDQEEAITLSDRVIVLKDGAIQQESPPHELYNNPCNLFVSRFIGSPTINTFEASLTSDGRLTTPHFERSLSDSKVEEIGAERSGDGLIFGIRPSDLYLTEDEADGQISGNTKIYEQMGDFTLLYLETENGDEPIRAKIPPSVIPDENEPFTLECDFTKAHLFDAKTEQNICHSLEPEQSVSQVR